MLNSRVVGARQIFRFFRQNTRFYENNKALSKFMYGILHYLITRYAQISGSTSIRDFEFSPVVYLDKK